MTLSSNERKAPWVLVSTGLNRGGGMERANLELARYLISQGIEVHLVTHHASSELRSHEFARIHEVSRPAGSFMLGEPILGFRGAAIATALGRKQPSVRVLVNGGCCTWPDINWVHCVHAAWQTYDEGAPFWFKAKNRAMKLMARRQERLALGQARVVIANSKKTKREIRDLMGIPEAKIHTIYLGTDQPRQFGLKERRRGRVWLGKCHDRPIIAFVGAMGHDSNKGFDTLWKAWIRLCAMQAWDADLVVAGGGRAVRHWQQRIVEAGLTSRTMLLGFTDKVSDLLAASDLLVSPVRYESFGLNVQEALAGGTPAIVSATAGVAEWYPSYLKELLLPDPNDVDNLIRKLLAWRGHFTYWKERIEPLSRQLRAYTWEAMARQIVECTSTSTETALQAVANAAATRN